MVPLAEVARAAARCGFAITLAALPFVSTLPLAACLPFVECLPLTVGRAGFAGCPAAGRAVAAFCLARTFPSALTRSSFPNRCQPATPFFRARSASCFLDRVDSGSLDISRGLPAPGGGRRTTLRTCRVRPWG